MPRMGDGEMGRWGDGEMVAWGRDLLYTVLYRTEESNGIAAGD
jgi:hypothetical protein